MAVSFRIIFSAAPWFCSINFEVLSDNSSRFCCIYINAFSNSIAFETDLPILWSMKACASGKRLCFGPKITGKPNTAGSSMLCRLPENPPPT